MGKFGRALLLIFSVLMGKALADTIMHIAGINLWWFTLLFTFLYAIVLHDKFLEIVEEVKKQ